MCIFSNIPASMMLFDIHGKLVDANDRCYTYHNVDDIDQLQGSLRVNAKWTTIVSSVTKAGKGVSSPFQYSFNYKDGKKWSKAVANPVLDEDGKMIGVSILEKDITLKKNMLSELQQLKLKETA